VGSLGRRDSPIDLTRRGARDTGDHRLLRGVEDLDGILGLRRHEAAADKIAMHVHMATRE
jgi:hypothetical protein